MRKRSRYEIAVIVLTYNADFIRLKQTLVSVLEQKDCNFQIIVADDASKNNYFSEIKKIFNEYQFVEIDDAYSTGSSIMPQKKNPDIAELVRGKTGRVYGALMSMLTTMKGIPLAYNKDMQEDKELTFDAYDTVKGCLALFTGMLATMKFNTANMEASAKLGYTNATDAADYLVNHGVAFRDAHGIVGQLVLYGIEHNKALDDFTMEEYKAISPVFEEDIYEAISMETCVNKRLTKGAPGREVMKKTIITYKEYLSKM